MSMFIGKFLVSIMLCLCFPVVAHPMKRLREMAPLVFFGTDSSRPEKRPCAEQICSYDVLPEEQAFSFDLSPEWFQDILQHLAQFLDKETRSALTLVSKNHVVALQPNLAEAAMKGMSDLVRGYLADPGRKKIFDLLRREESKQFNLENGCKFKIFKYLLGEEKIYAHILSVPNNQNMWSIIWATKGNDDRRGLFIFNSDCRVGNNVLSFDQNHANSLKESIENYYSSGPASEEFKELDTLIKNAKMRDRLSTSYQNQAKKSSNFMYSAFGQGDMNQADLAYLTDCDDYLGTNFEFFCMNILFIVAAKKNHGGVVEVFYQDENVFSLLTPFTLMIAGHMTTDESIKQAIEYMIILKDQIPTSTLTYTKGFCLFCLSPQDNVIKLRKCGCSNTCLDCWKKHVSDHLDASSIRCGNVYCCEPLAIDDLNGIIAEKN